MTLFPLAILQATTIIILGITVLKLKSKVIKTKQELHVANLRMLQAEQDLRGFINSGNKFQVKHD